VVFLDTLTLREVWSVLVMEKGGGEKLGQESWFRAHVFGSSWF
jgi:hypothetical protein